MISDGSDMDVTNKHTALARIRKKSGFTQLQIADSLGVSKATYSAWETGRAKLGEDRIVALCDLFGCTPNDILGYTKDPDGSPAFFTAQEDEYLSLFKALPPNIKADILDIMRYTTKAWRL